MATPAKAGDLSLLSDEQVYVVTLLRAAEAATIKPHRSNEPLIMLGNLPVCTWPTLFSLLGREVLVSDDATGGYALAPAWAKDAKVKV